MSEFHGLDDDIDAIISAAKKAAMRGFDNFDLLITKRVLDWLRGKDISRDEAEALGNDSDAHKGKG